MELVSAARRTPLLHIPPPPLCWKAWLSAGIQQRIGCGFESKSHRIGAGVMLCSARRPTLPQRVSGGVALGMISPGRERALHPREVGTLAARRAARTFDAYQLSHKSVQSRLSACVGKWSLVARRIHTLISALGTTRGLAMRHTSHATC